MIPARRACGAPLPETDCWLWTGSRSHEGYGRIKVKGRWQLAHRVAWVALVGPLTDGLVLDHKCRVRHCVNPEHLREVTSAENTLAPGSLSPSAVNALRTHCKNGHPLSEKETRTAPNGRRFRVCRTCYQQYEQHRYWRDVEKSRARFRVGNRRCGDAA